MGDESNVGEGKKEGVMHLVEMGGVPSLSAGVVCQKKTRGTAVLSQSLIGLRAAMSLALPARRCYQSSRD